MTLSEFPSMDEFIGVERVFTMKVTSVCETEVITKAPTSAAGLYTTITDLNGDGLIDQTEFTGTGFGTYDLDSDFLLDEREM